MTQPSFANINLPMTIYAIGDSQGCHQRVIALIERIQSISANPKLIFAGDLVNRGPDSLGMLRKIRSLGNTANVVLGNHDLHLLAVANGIRKPHRSDTLDDILHAPDRDELLDWLRRWPLLHHDNATGFTMIHAGLPPQWDLAVNSGGKAAQIFDDAGAVVADIRCPMVQQNYEGWQLTRMSRTYVKDGTTYGADLWAGTLVKDGSIPARPIAGSDGQHMLVLFFHHNNFNSWYGINYADVSASCQMEAARPTTDQAMFDLIYHSLS